MSARPLLCALLLVSTGCSSKIPLDLGPVFRNPTSRSVATTGVTASDTLRVVSYNIEFNRHMDAAERELRCNPRLRHADVILLQEVDLFGTLRLANALGMGYAYDAVSYHPKSKGGFWGNAVLSRYPLDTPWRARLPGHRSVTDRRMMGCTIHHPRGDILTISLHAETSVMNLAPWGGGQANQWRFAARTASERGATFAYVIVGGDFNSAPILPLLFPSVAKLDEIFDERGFVRLTPGREPTSRDGYRLDHVFGIGLAAQRSGVAADTRASDHHPVWSVVTFTR